MHRFFIGPQQLTGQTARITGEDMAHMSRVLRLRAGDLVTLCDGAGMDYEARLRSLGKEASLLALPPSPPPTGTAIISHSCAKTEAIETFLAQRET